MNEHYKNGSEEHEKDRLNEFKEEIDHEREEIQYLQEVVDYEKKKLSHLSEEIEEIEKEEWGEQEKNHVRVAVITTAGSWPKEGFAKIPSAQKIKIFLAIAAKELKIISVDKWVATVDGKEIDPELSYFENKLSEKISIDYGPNAGGGGNE